MKLTDLDAEFVRREIRPCHAGAAGCSVVSEHTEHEWHVPASFGDADGITFLCPKCRDHYVLCWRPRVPPEVSPKPGRWEFQGTGLDDLSLVAVPTSVALLGGCNAHFLVQAGAIIMA